jgi:acid phosphatase (class A)
LVLAELAPDSATSLLARARAFGESRIVCGVHNMSAVEAGWMTATAVFAAQNASAAFRADLDPAKTELSTLRTSASVDPAGDVSVPSGVTIQPKEGTNASDSDMV